MSQDHLTLIKKAIKDGWRVERRSKHFMLFSPDGERIITTSTSPGNSTQLNRLKADLSCK